MTKNNFHESAQELERIKKRREIRQRLQAEFNRIYYNPYRYAQHIEIADPAVSRYSAMRVSLYEHWKPNWGSFWKWSLMTYIPIICLGLRMHYNFAEVDRKCRTGEIPYEKREIRRI